MIRIIDLHKQVRWLVGNITINTTTISSPSVLLWIGLEVAQWYCYKIRTISPLSSLHFHFSTFNSPLELVTHVNTLDEKMDLLRANLCKSILSSSDKTPMLFKTHWEKTNKGNSNDVSSWFVLCQCVAWSPAWRFCTT